MRRTAIPESASTAAERHDTLFYFLLYLSAGAFVLVIGLTVLFAIKYRRQHDTVIVAVWFGTEYGDVGAGIIGCDLHHILR